MIHYHVWFNLKPGIPEQAGLRTVSQFLSELAGAGEASGFQLLKNTGKAPKSKLAAYHALVEFAGFDALGAAMKKQTARGIHHGSHGKMVDVVCDFHVEVFEQVDPFPTEGAPVPTFS